MPIWQRFQQKAWETVSLELDVVPRPEPAAARSCCLMRVDKMSMGASLEARVPFLDHKFVELALGIPSGGQNEERDAEVHPQEGHSRGDSGRSHRSQEAGIRISLTRLVHGRTGRLCSQDAFGGVHRDGLLQSAWRHCLNGGSIADPERVVGAEFRTLVEKTPSPGFPNHAASW